MPIFIDVFHEFYGTAIVPTFIDIVPFLINIVPTYNLFLNIFQLRISRFFKLASPGSYSQLIVIFVLLWIPPS